MIQVCALKSVSWRYSGVHLNSPFGTQCSDWNNDVRGSAGVQAVQFTVGRPALLFLLANGLSRSVREAYDARTKSRRFRFKVENRD